MMAQVQGVDVSHWNGLIDWPKLAGDGVRFAYIKATQGAAEDPMFATNAAAAQAAGILTLAYPFLTATDDDGCVEKFDSVVGPSTAAVLDCEVAGIGAAVSLWVAGLAKRPTLAYIGMSPPFDPPAALWTLPRILPEYANAPRLPAWDGVSVPDWQNEWLIWQRSGQGTFQGETGNFDLDVLSPSVSIEQFAAWCRTGKWQPVAAATSLAGPAGAAVPSLPASRAGLQTALNAAGAQVAVDGVWGPESEAALDAYVARLPYS